MGCRGVLQVAELEYSETPCDGTRRRSLRSKTPKTADQGGPRLRRCGSYKLNVTRRVPVCLRYYNGTLDRPCERKMTMHSRVQVKVFKIISLSTLLLIVSCQSLAAPVAISPDDVRDNSPIFARWGCCGKPKTTESPPDSPPRGSSPSRSAGNSPAHSSGSSQTSSSGHWAVYVSQHVYPPVEPKPGRPAPSPSRPHTDYDLGGWRGIFDKTEGARQPYTKIVKDDGGKRRVSYAPANAMPLSLGTNGNSAGAGPSGTAGSPGHSRNGSGSTSPGSSPHAESPVRDPSKGKAPMSSKRH